MNLNSDYCLYESVAETSIGVQALVSMKAMDDGI